MTLSIIYIGRYAPSPTGDLHLNNLQTATLALMHAPLNNGKLLLRDLEWLAD